MEYMKSKWARSKTLRVSVTIIGAIILTFALVFGIFSLSPAGKSYYKAVEIPELSTELTEVPEPPVGVADTPDAPHIQVDMLGQKVSPPDHSVNTSPEIVENRTREMNQVSNVGKRVKIPAIGLDVPLGEMTVVDDVVEPTNFTSVFAIRNMGVPYTEANKGTVYLATHALDMKPQGNIFSYSPGGLAPGNFFFDTANDSIRVHEGDEMTIGDKKFKITGSERIGKGLIGKDEQLWNASVPNRVVILLCHPDSNDNHIIYAAPM